MKKLTVNSEAIRVEMAKQMISQAELSRRLGVTQSAVSRWWSGKSTEVHVATVGNIAQALGVEYTGLLTWIDSD